MFVYQNLRPTQFVPKSSRFRRTRLSFEMLENREVLSASVVNVVPTAPPLGTVSTFQNGAPTALNLPQSGNSQPNSTVGTQSSFLSPGNASPILTFSLNPLFNGLFPSSPGPTGALNPSLNGLVSGITASPPANNPGALSLLIPAFVYPLTNFPTTQAINLSVSPGLPPVTPLSSAAPDLGYFLLGDESSLRESFISDLPDAASRGHFQINAPAPVPQQQSAIDPALPTHPAATVLTLEAAAPLTDGATQRTGAAPNLNADTESVGFEAASLALAEQGHLGAGSVAVLALVLGYAAFQAPSPARTPSRLSANAKR
jgi:hypothetical protein